MPTSEFAITLDQDYRARVSANRYGEWRLEELWSVTGSHREVSLVEHVERSDPRWAQAEEYLEENLSAEIEELSHEDQREHERD